MWNKNIFNKTFKSNQRTIFYLFVHSLIQLLKNPVSNYYNMLHWNWSFCLNITFQIYWASSSFNQLLRQTLFTFPESKADLFLFTMWPATEKSRSQGPVVAGVARYLWASEASFSWAPEWDAHHLKAQSSNLMVGSALYLCMAGWTSSSSDSESEPICRRLIFFLGGPSSCVFEDFLGDSCCSIRSSVVHTASLSVFETRIQNCSNLEPCIVELFLTGC